MTNHEVLLRLSVDKHDHLAVMSLHDNNAEIIRTTLIRYFGKATVRNNVECALMQRMADHARLYEDPEDPDAWLARCVNTECDRLRNEAIRDEADNARRSYGDTRAQLLTGRVVEFGPCRGPLKYRKQKTE